MDDVLLGDGRIDRLGEGRAQLDCGQLEGPAAERVAVVVDRPHVLPRLEERLTSISWGHGGWVKVNQQRGRR